ncbi:MAG TPA: acyl-ACP--UDP-N-acetylglucosamine O-acyltransferase [Dongiaceae bacterium]|jgi:UDP-N-acetylglucosamine acyltransferase|nr:acyl-ACP--UDP-N-acetylglucosamine O-acyltransferase [Dongiaceae bacterium]
MIHATAIVHPQARLDVSVSVGPFAVIDANVTVGARCVIGPHVHLTGHTTIGTDNVFHTGAVIGDAPQDLKYHGEPTRLVIGDHNVFREHATVHRSNNLADETVIGAHNFLMANSHVGHDVKVGNHTVICNGVAVAGHAIVSDRAFLSANSLVHQFVRVGTLTLMQGGAAISKDLPPFTIARGGNGICGLNIIGLRRAGFSAAERLELKQVYRKLFRSGINLRAAISAARQEFSGPHAQTLLEFVATSKRGVCTDAGATAGSAPEDE